MMEAALHLTPGRPVRAGIGDSMPHRIIANRALDGAGIVLWGAGTALTGIEHQDIMAAALAVLGIIVMVGRAARSEYHEWAAIRRSEREADLKLEVMRSQRLSSARHEQIMDDMAELKNQIGILAERACANIDCPQRKACDGMDFTTEKGKNNG